MIPYSQISKSKDKTEFVHFYEHDVKFRNLLLSPAEEAVRLSQFSGAISPDCSLYRDMPLVLQFVNVYFNRAIGHFMQKNGIYVIPNVRWGDERSYTSRILGEKVAFLGVPKRSIVSIGTYGCIRSKEDKMHFRSGLEAMLQYLEPQVVVIYGAMPDSIFGSYKKEAAFYQYPDWISQKRGR